VKYVRSFADGLLRADTNMSLNGVVAEKTMEPTMHTTAALCSSTAVSQQKVQWATATGKYASFFHARPESHGYSQ
jgi:hypothetical protein